MLLPLPKSSHRQEPLSQLVITFVLFSATFGEFVEAFSFSSIRTSVDGSGAGAGSTGSNKGTTGDLQESTTILGCNKNKNNGCLKEEYSNFNYRGRKNSNLRKQFQSDGILYKKSVLSQSEFQLIQNQLSRSNLSRRDIQNEKTNTVARNRVGMSLSSVGGRGRDSGHESIVRVLSDPNGSLVKLVNDIAGPEPGPVEDGKSNGDNERDRRMVLSRIVPVEVSKNSNRYYIFDVSNNYVYN